MPRDERGPEPVPRRLRTLRGVISVTGVNNRQIDMRTRILRILQQEFLESQLGVDKVSGRHRRGRLLEQRQSACGNGCNVACHLT